MNLSFLDESANFNDDSFDAVVRSYANMVPGWNGTLSIDTAAQSIGHSAVTFGVKFSQWTGMWADIGVAHEARVFMKEVSLENGKLVVGDVVPNRSPE